MRDALAGLGSPIGDGKNSRAGSITSSVAPVVENRYFNQAVEKAAENQAAVESLRNLLANEKQLRQNAEGKVKELETAAESRDNVVLELQRQIADAKTDVQLNENKYKSQISQKDQAIANKDSVFAIERESWNKAKKELEEKVKKAVEVKTTEKLRAMEVVAKLQTQYDSLVTKHAELTKSVQDMQNSSDTDEVTKKRIETLTTELDGLRQSQEDGQQRESTLKTENDKLQAKVKELEETNAQLTSDNSGKDTEHQGEIQKLQLKHGEALVAKDVKRVELERTIDSLNKQLESQAKSLSSVREELKTVTTARNTAEAAVTRLGSELSNVQNSLVASRQQLSNAEADYTTLDAQKTTLETELSKAKADKKTAEDAINELNKKLADAEHEEAESNRYLEMAATTRHKLEKDVKALQHNEKNLKTALDQSNEVSDTFSPSTIAPSLLV